MTNTINVGDKVRVLHDMADSQFEAGTILMVIEDDETSLPYRCKSSEGEFEWMHASEIELVSSALEDRVAALEAELATIKASLAPKPAVELAEGDSAKVRPFTVGEAAQALPPIKNETRRLAVQVAKNSVKNSFEKDWKDNDVIPSWAGNLKAFFTVNKELRTVNVVLKYAYTGTDTIVGRGQATCDPTDVFNVHIGKAIALDRALGRVTDERILRAPNPDVLVPGMVVEDTYFRGQASGKVASLKTGAMGSPGYVSTEGGWSFIADAVIVEDTDAQY